MAYTTGTATSTADLASQLDTFLTSNGWSRDKFVDGGGTADEYYWNDGGNCFVSIRLTANEIKIFPNTGFDTNAAVNAQPGMDLDGSWDDLPPVIVSGTNNAEGQLSNCPGPYTAHHFFLDERFANDYLIVQLEQAPGVSRWFGFGTAVPSGNPAIDHCQYVMVDGFVNIGATESRLVAQGGPFAMSTGGGKDAGFCIRLELDGVGPDWYGASNNAPQGNTTEDFVTSTNPYDNNTRSPFAGHFGYTYSSGGSPTEYDLFATYSGIYPKTMMQFWATRPLGDSSPDAYSLVARLPAMFFLNIKQFTPGQVITIDGDDYIIFAEGRKVTHPQSGAGPNTQTFGVAMLRDL